jgi:hypothetical protein
MSIIHAKERKEDKQDARKDSLKRFLLAEPTIHEEQPIRGQRLIPDEGTGVFTLNGEHDRCCVAHELLEVGEVGLQFGRIGW